MPYQHPSTHVYTTTSPFHLELGGVLPHLEIAYTAYGNRNAGKTIWICHALTANANPMEWWPSLVGEGKHFDPKDSNIICANILGSCYGTSGPLSIDPSRKEPYYSSFPNITIRDMVRAHQLLAQHLQVPHIDLLIGGSMGGYQALEWAIMEPAYIKQMVLLSTGARESAWGQGIHSTQRMAIEQDTTWKDLSPAAGRMGIQTARAIGMLTYRNYEHFASTQTEPDNEKTTDFKIASYLKHQGEKLANRFNAYAYWLLSHAMDSHNVGRGRKNCEVALSTVRAQTLIIGISSDFLCPLNEQAFLSHHIPGASFKVIDSPLGHDGFLIEGEKIAQAIGECFIHQ